ncbi:MAG: response regulator [Bryobacteraceae bacterium]
MSRTVLIVEDAETCASTLEIALLAIPNVDVITAVSGSTAWQILQAHEVSAVLTDLHLPQMDGFELIGRLRAAPRFANLPIIVLSGDSDPDTPDRLRSLGADAYFVKPYSPAAVRETLERLLHADSPPVPT